MRLSLLKVAHLLSQTLSKFGERLYHLPGHESSIALELVRMTKIDLEMWHIVDGRT